jgi:hypothetical protein
LGVSVPEVSVTKYPFDPGKLLGLARRRRNMSSQLNLTDAAVVWEAASLFGGYSK